MIGGQLVCLRCGHTWNSRVEGRPKQCPLCHQPNWDRTKGAMRVGGLIPTTVSGVIAADAEMEREFHLLPKPPLPPADLSCTVDTQALPWEEPVEAEPEVHALQYERFSDEIPSDDFNQVPKRGGGRKK